MLISFIANCSEVIPDNAPKIEYHIDSENPYAARFGVNRDMWGEEVWVTEMKKFQHFFGVIYITDLVKHIVGETQIFFKNTEHSDT